MTTGERLRTLADWFDEHPDAPIGYGLRDGASFYTIVSGIDDFKTLGSFTKRFVGDSFEAVIDVGGYRLVWFTERSNVCTPRVVGKKMVPEETIEGLPTRIIAAHEEDIIEWDCSPVLGEHEAQAESIEQTQEQVGQ